ncbi:MAG: hypothetical protein HUJ68_07850 [Clostridia bacterium]|nr:hypothetical protein [Clostridia bacterium]
MTQKQGFKSLYGYLICYIGIVHFTLDKKFIPATESAIKGVLSELRGQICGNYRKLDQPEKQRLRELSPLEVMWLNIVLNLSPAETTVVMQTSFFYKIKRAVNLIPGKVKEARDCFRKHGLGYTVKKILSHLGIKG